jgi:hypothetical protein
MKHKLLHIILLLFISSFIGCDKIDEPLKKEKKEVKRKFLIEDFTGHQCGNCPRAAETAKSLQEIYGENLIVVSIHVGWFARTLNDPSGKYATDFRTPAGDAYNQLWKNDATGLPNGFVNRSAVINNQIIVQHSAWGEAVELLKDSIPIVDLEVKLNYNENSRALNTEVKATGIKRITGNYKLVLYLLEDNVVDWQKDYSLPSGNQDIQDYKHRHVLRDNINGVWGEPMINGSLAENESISKTFNYTLKNGWNDANCSVVAYLYNVDTYEILQVEEVYLKK